MCRLVAKRLLSESANPDRNVAALMQDVHAHREAVRMATAFNAHPVIRSRGVRLMYGPLYIVKTRCLVSQPIDTCFTANT